MNVKQRIIYDNYNLCDMYDECKAFLEEEYPEEKPIAEDSIWDEVYFQDSRNWEDERDRMGEFFNHLSVIVAANLGLWDGRHAGYQVFDSIDNAISTCFRDCDYIRLWDENGKFLMKGSHHDGTNYYQLKIVNGAALEYLDNWNTKKSYDEKLQQVFNSNFYSKLPHFAHIVYGCPKKEVEKND